MPENIILRQQKKQSQNTKENQNYSKQKIQFLFLLIVIFSFYLRLSGIYSGLPYVLNPAESNNMLDVLSVFKHIFRFDSFETPSLFVYLNAIVVFFASWTFDVNSMLNILEVNPSGFYVPLRFVSTLFGIGSVVVVYLIGTMFSYLAGIIAGSFLAVSFLHVKFSQMFLPFSGMAFFSLLSTYFSLKSMVSKSPKIVLATICALISASMNYIGCVSIIPVLLVLIYRKNLSKIKYLSIAFLISFFILNPQIIFNFIEIIWTAVKNYRDGYYFYRYSAYFLYIFHFLLIGIGPVVCIAPLFLLKYKDHYDLNALKILLSVPFVYLGILGFFHFTNEGYAVMLVPYICLFSGFVFNSLYLDHDKKFTFILLLLFAIWIPFKYTIKYNKIISLSDTRVIATEWINDNASGQVKIVHDRNSIQNKWFDVYDKKRLVVFGSDPDLLTSRQDLNIVNSKFLSRKDWFKSLRRKTD